LQSLIGELEVLEPKYMVLSCIYKAVVSDMNNIPNEPKIHGQVS